MGCILFVIRLMCMRPLPSLCILFVSFLQPQARDKAEQNGFEIRVAKTSFKANTKALAENEAEGLAKVIIDIG